MICVKETTHGNLIDMCVDGALDCESIPILEKICQVHLQEEKRVILHIEGLSHISREGREFLKKISGKITVLDRDAIIKSAE